MDIDYNAHKYSDNQLGIMTVNENSYPGSAEYSVFIPKSQLDDIILIYKIDEEKNDYKFIGEFAVDEKNDIKFIPDSYGKYILANGEITGELIVPYEDGRKKRK